MIDGTDNIVFPQVCLGCHSECEAAQREKMWKQELLG